MADVRERLAKRNEERLQTIDKRKLENNKRADPDESKDLFKATFLKEKTELEDLLGQCESMEVVDKQAVSQHFEKMTTKWQQLQRYLADSTMFLPSYDVKLTQDKLNALQQAINDERDRLMPKKKFAFRTRKKEVEASAGEKQNQDLPDGIIMTKSLDTKSTLVKTPGFRGLKGQELTMKQDETAQQDVTFSDLADCAVKLLGPASTLHMDRLSTCTILCAPVATSIFIDECTNCTFVLACQQLRVHKTSKSKFYLHVTSRAIIEDCTDVGFAPYLLEYDDKLVHFEAAGLDAHENNWSLVNDFNWLRKDEPSPNWFIVPEEDRTKWTLNHAN